MGKRTNKDFGRNKQPRPAVSHAPPGSLWFCVQAVVTGLLVFMLAASIGIGAGEPPATNPEIPFGIVEPGFFWEDPVYLRLLVNGSLPTSFTATEESGIVSDLASMANFCLGLGTGILADSPETIVRDRLYGFRVVSADDSSLPPEQQWDSFLPGNVIVPAPVDSQDGVQVIIFHTHTTESFLPTSGVNFTENLDLTVAKLGEELLEILEQEYGIRAVHNQKIHDLPRSSAYRKALPTLRQLLAENPHAQIVIDLHRDGVAREHTTAEVDGQEVGALMFVVGKNHSSFHLNDSFARRLDDHLRQISPAISKGVDYSENYSYNQEYHPRSVIVEVGGHENSLEEALRSIPYLAEAIASYYQELKTNSSP